MTSTLEHARVSTAAMAPTPLIAIASLIISMALVAVGNGLMFAFIPVRLGAADFAPTWAGAILTGLSAGGIAGCLLTGPLVRRVGHARAFMVLSGLIALSNCGIGAGVYPWLWLAARTLYGFAICGMFIVAQSWLNDAIGNEIRGRVMAIFYVAYVMGLGVGYYVLGLIDIDGAQAAIIGIAFTALSILPVGLTRLTQPPPPAVVSVSLAEAWRISPVGIVGMLAVGGLSMIVIGFAPIHATARGYSQQEVATLLSVMPLGTILLQIPFGWVSDRTDRRYVLLVSSTLAFAGGLLAIGFDGSPLVWLIPIYLLWDGASESIYSLANAHASDRASKSELLTLASAMLLVWSVSGFVVLGLVTALTGYFGTRSFMYVAVVIAAAYAAFVIWRILAAPRVPKAEAGSFAPMIAQAPIPVDLAFDDETPRA